MTKLIFPVLFFTFLSCNAFSQKIDSMMQVYAINYPQQKVHLHFDKSLYRAGETIWFKAYILEGYSPSATSSGIYVEMVDANGKMIESKVYPVVEASAAGFFDIPQTSPATVVTIRAYTKWMLNFDTSFIFQKPLTILTQAGALDKTVNKEIDKSTTSLSFFPEGGNLVSGLESVVAFKANDNKGLPVSVTGSVTDSKGNVVSNFKTVHNGMGKLVFTPTLGEVYSAIWKDSTNNERTTVLPAVSSSGIVLSTQLLNEKLVYKIARTDNASEEMHMLFVVAHVAQQLAYKTKVPLQSSLLTSGVIPLNSIPSGVLQLTVFNNNWEPLAERIIMVNNGQHLFDATVSTPLVNTERRSKNVIEVDVTDTLLSNMSISVTDAAIGHLPLEDNIISRLLLTGDIRGYVHQPAYYFSNDSDSVSNHLDLVMLTHGWRKYNWKDVVNKKVPALRFQADTLLMLQAKIFGLGSTRLQQDESLLAIMEGKDSSNRIFLLPKMNANTFAAPIVFFDTVKVYYQFQKNKKLENTASVLLSNNFYKGPRNVDLSKRPYLVPPTEIAINRTKLLASELAKYKSDVNFKGNVLETVTVRTRVKSRVQELDDKYTFGLFKGSDGQAFDMTDPMNNFGSLNIFAFLQGRVAGININNPMGADPSVTWRGSATSLFLDEMPVDAQTLSTINVNDVAYIKTIRPPFMGASGGGAGGAIAVYTKKGNDIKYQPGVGLSRSTVVGYSKNKEFYSPDYSNKNAAEDVAADYRSTLYWQPYLFTDASSKKVKIQFYNNDISKSFRIVLEGINELGKMVRIEKVVSQ